MAKIKVLTKNKFNKVLGVILSVAVSLGALVGIGAIATSIENDPLKTITPTYHVGGLDNEGKFQESNKSIYSDLFECKGLKITPDFESDISYRVFYYDSNETYLDKVDKIFDAYVSEPNFASFCRIEITPINF